MKFEKHIQKTLPALVMSLYWLGHERVVSAEPTAAMAPPAAVCVIPDDALVPVGGSNTTAIDRLAPPDWRRYSYVEGLIMGRNNQAFNRPLLVDDATLTIPALTTRDLGFPYGGGLRTFFGSVGTDCRGWEVGYLGLYDMNASATVPTVADGYALPGGFAGQTLPPLDSATITNSTTVNSVEANMFHHFERWNFYRDAWLEVDWLLGFRYVNVDDAAQMQLICCDGRDVYGFPVGTHNNMFGGQMGGRARLNWQRWALEGWGKAAILGNAAEQYQNPDPEVRGYTSSSTGSMVGMVADLNVSAIYRLSEVWGIRMGFNTIWIGGVALALDQYDFSSTTANGFALQDGGSLFLSGVNAGLEARW